MKSIKEYINESFLMESFFTKLFGTGTSVDSFISKIKLGIQTLNKEEPNTVFGQLDWKKVSYDEKEHVIKYDGDADFQCGFKKYGSAKAIIPIKIDSRLSDNELKKLSDEFGKTKLGKEIYKHSNEFKTELKKKYEEQAKKDAEDPEKLAYKCAELLKEMKRIGDSSDEKYKKLSEQFNELERKGKKIDENKFKRAYDKACDKLDVRNTKPYKSGGSSRIHAGENYGDGHSSYDNMGR